MVRVLRVGIAVIVLAAAGQQIAQYYIERALEPPPRAVRAMGPDYRNIEKADYVGPASCAECHEEQHALWSGHPHSVMNQNPGPATVKGDYSGVTVRYGRLNVTFDQADGHYRQILERDGEKIVYHVTRTVGSRFTQMYIGVRIAGGEGPSSEEIKLPFGYWFRRKAWLPESYFDSDYDPEYMEGKIWSEAIFDTPPDQKWTESCAFCHNTYAYKGRIGANERVLTGFPKTRLDHPDKSRLRRALDPEADLVILGISCESCHFGGREHVATEGDTPVRFQPMAPDLHHAREGEPKDDEREDAYLINSICAQCHAAYVSRYADGSATWNSREALDLRESDCDEPRCTSCHEPHTASPPGGGPDLTAHLDVCASCHEGYGEDHSKHDATVTCMDCHMPRRVQGLETVIRTHRISAPTDERMLAAAAPNACNLCHLDRPVTWTVEQLNRHYDTKLEADPAWAEAYGGDLSTPLSDVWAHHHRDTYRLVVSDALARHGGRTALPQLLDGLMDPIAVNRMFYLFAIERLLGRPITDAEYDPIRSPDERQEQVRALRQALTPR